MTGLIDYSPESQAQEGSISQTFNTTKEYDMEPNNTPMSCGTAQSDNYIVFHETDGDRAFRAKFTYGCGQCPAAIL